MNSNYVLIAKKAKEIACQIGYPIIKEEYYTDRTIGHNYTYKGLEITYYEEEDYVSIEINKTRLLTYNFKYQKMHHTDGKWTELIEIIYGEIPNVLTQRRQTEENIQKKIQELKTLEPYCLKCLSCDITRLNYSFKAYNMHVNKHEHYSTYRNNVTGDYENRALADIIYSIYYNDKSVLKFYGNPRNIFPNISRNIEDFTPGAWTEIFKIILDVSFLEETEIIQKKIDNSANTLIKQFKKDYN